MIKQKIKNLIYKLIPSSFGFEGRLDGKHGGRRIVNSKGFVLYFCRSAILSLILRPRYAVNFNCVGSEKSCNDLAIIIQGPILYDNNFTLETIKIYLKTFPNAYIIVSTWTDINLDFHKKISELGCHVVLNKKPTNNGFGNINLQIVSTFAGLKKADELGAKFSIKSRTDWRIYAPDSLMFLKNLLSIFPVEDNSIIKSRIISSEMTCKLRIYGLTDTFQFGFTKDLLFYWNVGDWLAELDNHFQGNKIINSTPLICEIFLCALYLKKIGHPLQWSLQCWWKALKKYFIVIDHSSLDMIFYKYDYFFEQRRLRSYLDKYSRAVSFVDWVNLYSGSIDGWNEDNQMLAEKWKIDALGNFEQIQV